MPTTNQRVGEYVLDRQVGGGAFGQVWQAHHHVWSDQKVAVKIPTDPQYLRALQHEGSAIHGLIHPNIVRAINFDPYAATPYLVMELVDGSSLRPLVAQKKLTVPESVAILRQVLSGLSYAHKHNIVHRDVKPENILIASTADRSKYIEPGVVKVTDFGLGKAATASAGSIAFTATLNDDAGREIAGSLDYMAPEQRAGGKVDPRADLYACGVVLYELLTGEKPAGTELPSDLNKSVPKALDEVFRRSYARLEKRFTSADEFAAALGSKPPSPPAMSIKSDGPPARRAIPAHPPAGRIVPCPRCRMGVDGSDQFCMHCGVQLVAQVRRCPDCGGYPDPNDSSCHFCGKLLLPRVANH